MRQTAGSLLDELYLRQFHPLFISAVHPLGRFAFFGLHHIPDPAKPETWVFFMYISFPWTVEQQEDGAGCTNEKQLDQVKQLAKGFADPWKSGLEWMPAETPVWHMGMRVWDPSQDDHRWDTHDGRVTLAGDAAHSMTYRKLPAIRPTLGARAHANHDTRARAGSQSLYHRCWQTQRRSRVHVQ
jgi:hypothetical protein